MLQAMNSEDLVESVRAIWGITLGLEVEPIEELSEDSFDEETISSEVHIVGHWNGVVSVVAAVSVAREAARSLFFLNDIDPDDEQICAALMELVNMTGGNIKGRFDVQSVLSIPRARRQIGYESKETMVTEDLKLAFMSEYGPFMVYVLKNDIQSLDDLLNF